MCRLLPARPTDEESGKLSDFEWKELLTPGSRLFERWSAQVDAVAGYLKLLQDAGVPAFWRAGNEASVCSRDRRSGARGAGGGDRPGGGGIRPSGARPGIGQRGVRVQRGARPVQLHRGARYAAEI